MHKRFWKNFGILGSTELILRLKGLVLMPLLTAHLGTIHYGSWAQVSLITTFFPMLILLGTDASLVRYLPGEDQKTKGQWYCAWLTWGILFSILLGTLSLIFKDALSAILFGPGEDFVRFLPLAVIYGCITVLLSMGRRWFKIHHDGVSESVITVAQAVGGVLAVLTMYKLNQGIYALIIYTIMAEGFIAIATLLYLFVRYGIYKPDFSILPRAIKFGLPLLPAGISLWVITLTDRLFLIHLNGLDVVGIYAIGVSLAKIISILILRPIRYMYPPYSAELYNQKRYEDFGKFFNLVLYLTVLFMLPAIAGLTQVSGEMVRILTPDSFSNAEHVIPLTALGLFINAIAGYFSAWVYLDGKPVLITFSMIASALVNVVLNFILIPEFGITGAAIASILAYTADFVILVFLALTKYKIAKIEWKKLIAPTLASITMAGVLYIIFNVLETPLKNDIIILFTKTLSGIGIYFGLLLISGQLPVKDIQKFLTNRKRTHE